MVIACDGETVAAAAAAALDRALAQPGAVALISRSTDGRYHVGERAHAVDRDERWGMFFGLLFGVLFFVPAFGVPAGAGIDALRARIEGAGLDARAQQRITGMVKLRGAALFVIAGGELRERALALLGAAGGDVLEVPISREREARLQAALLAD